MHQRVLWSVLTLLSIRRVRRTNLNEVPKEVVAIIGVHLWKTKSDLVGWKESF